jgi:hypothetical protein
MKSYKEIITEELQEQLNLEKTGFKKDNPIPSRQSIEVLPADKPAKPLGFSCYEITDEDVSFRDNEENAALRKQIREGTNIINTIGNTTEDTFSKFGMCYTTIPVLPFLTGKKLNNMIYNFLQCCRPSCVRIVKQNEGMHADSRSWRITIYIDENNMIKSIEQEVECGTLGIRNGQDAHNFMENNYEALDRPQARCYINPRCLEKLKNFK